MTASEGSAPPKAAAPEQRPPPVSMRILMVRRFCRNRVALVSLIILGLFYLAMAFAGFVSPYSPVRSDSLYLTAPPQQVRFFDAEGNFNLRPFVYRIEGKRDLTTFTFVYEEDLLQRDEIFFFIEGDEYTFLGATFNRHLFGTKEGTIYLLGTDLRGRDMVSRIIYGARVTLTIGLVGVALMITLGALIGALSGYIGGFLDMAVQRVIEVFRLFPPIPLWLALAAAVPPQLPSIYVLAAIVIIYGFIQWPGLAREVRGLVLVLRETEFVLASQAAGAGTFWVVRKHLIPSVMPHLLVTATLGVPVVIIFESTLSFFGLGVKPPTISWGLLLQQSQKLEVLSFYPWLLAPAGFLVVAALLFNFVGDGIRDAVDPHS